jgi:hypothetical protein
VRLLTRELRSNLLRDSFSQNQSSPGRERNEILKFAMPDVCDAAWGCERSRCSRAIITSGQRRCSATCRRDILRMRLSWNESTAVAAGKFELSYAAREAAVLPLNYSRNRTTCADEIGFLRSSPRLPSSWSRTRAGRGCRRIAWVGGRCKGEEERPAAKRRGRSSERRVTRSPRRRAPGRFPGSRGRLPWR